MPMVVKEGTMSVCKGRSTDHSSSAFSTIAYHLLCMANTFFSNSRSAVLQLISNRIFHCETLYMVFFIMNLKVVEESNTMPEMTINPKDS